MEVCSVIRTLFLNFSCTIFIDFFFELKSMNQNVYQTCFSKTIVWTGYGKWVQEQSVVWHNYSQNQFFWKKIETVTESNFLLTCKSKLLLFILKLLFRRYLSVKTVDLDNDQELFGDVLKTTTLLEQDLFYWFYNCVLEF